MNNPENSKEKDDCPVPVCKDGRVIDEFGIETYSKTCHGEGTIDPSESQLSDYMEDRWREERLNRNQLK
jgi:hypothetical protein